LTHLFQSKRNFASEVRRLREISRAATAAAAAAAAAAGSVPTMLHGSSTTSGVTHPPVVAVQPPVTISTATTPPVVTVHPPSMNSAPAVVYPSVSAES